MIRASHNMALSVCKSALALLLLTSFLACCCNSSTQLVDGASDDEGDPYKALREADRVVDLPGQPNVSFAHYAGYITVNASHQRALFYWFFEAASNVSSKPLLLWLNGGPGCSSVGYGEAEEIGPFIVNKDGASISLNEDAWNNEVNLLFLESPAGVGFSYSNTTSDYQNFGDTQTALDAYSFLLGWFERFPQYKLYDFYIAGESYAGHYVPQLAKLITDMNDIGNPAIYLKGIMIGNAALDDNLDSKGILDYAWSHAVLSDAFYQDTTRACNFSTETWSKAGNDQMNSLFQVYQNSPINIYSIFSDVCLTSYPGGKDRQQFLSLLEGDSASRFISGMARMIINGGTSGGADPCIDNYVFEYLNRADVQRALHANTTNLPYTWTACSNLITVWVDAPSSMLPTLKQLIALGLRIWVYSGDMDGRVPVLSSRYDIDALHIPTEIDWYPWLYKNQLGGWSQVYKGLTFATVRGAGHMVPAYQPGKALALLLSFLSGNPLPDAI